MTLAKFYSGTSAELEDKENEEGSIYFTTDTKTIVVDIPGGMRTSYGEQTELTAVTDTEVDAIFEKYF